jgi:hypothetical protein
MRVGFHISVFGGFEAYVGQLSNHVFTSFQKKTDPGIAKKVRQPENNFWAAFFAGLDPEGYEPVRRSREPR